jgi:hypothetical protein
MPKHIVCAYVRREEKKKKKRMRRKLLVDGKNIYQK